jgi:hypothetical protein
MNKAAQPGRGAVRSAIVHLSVCLNQAVPAGRQLLTPACLATPNRCNDRSKDSP